MSYSAMVQLMMQNQGIQYGAASQIKYLVESYSENQMSKLQFSTKLENLRKIHSNLGSDLQNERKNVLNLIKQVRSEFL